MKKLWEKNYKQDEEAEKYCSEDSVVYDNKLAEQDVLGSMAHAHMLSEIGIISKSEYLKLKSVLNEIIKLSKTGKFTVEFGDEDIHTKVENYLTEKLGETGKKIHTGRSRNDQVLLDIRLYSKENLFQTAQYTSELIESFLLFAKKYEFTPMPGYTHLRKAMPSSVGMWAGSFAESLLDDMEILKSAYSLNNQSPLGSGASYGVSIPINRELTAKLLGFSKVSNNSLYCQASRGKIQLAIMHSLSQIMITLSKFAFDLILFTTSEFNFFSIDPKLCTGSSIMPQKKNLDLMEALKAKTHLVIGFENIVSSIIAGLPSGYNADFGQTKKPFMESFEITIKSIKIVLLTIKSLSPKMEVLKKACTQELFAANAAFNLVKEGVSFREAYKKIGLSLDKIPDFDAVKILKESNHTGGPGNLGITKKQNDLKKIKLWWKKESNFFSNAIQKMRAGEK